VRAALCGDPTLWELLETPLMLSIAALAYQGRPAVEVSATGTLAERRAHLFAAYTDAMFKRRGKATPYTQQQTVRWLVWLAEAMVRHNQSMFYLEWMQPNWLPTRAQQKAVKLGAAITNGLVHALLVGLLVGLGFWLAGGLVFGLLVGLLYGLLGYEEKIRPVEALRWSWSDARYGLVPTLVMGLVFGLVFGLLVGLLYGLVGGLAGGLVFGLVFGLVPDKITTRTVPNEGIRQSARMALVFGLLVGLLVGLVGGLVGGLLFGLLVGLVGGLVYGLDKGGRACLQHLTLRFLLWGNDFAPWHYVRFLDYAAERVFLRKVGGGYIFVHRLLLEYFETLKP
jgi:predicted lipid-binding transport protein (Tim44 family)